MQYLEKNTKHGITTIQRKTIYKKSHQTGLHLAFYLIKLDLCNSIVNFRICQKNEIKKKQKKKGTTVHVMWDALARAMKRTLRVGALLVHA
jgi:hypothetical protein